MAKRNDHLLVLLTDAPWWVSVVVSGCAFVALTYLFPYYLDNGTVASEGFINASQSVAIYLSSILLLPAPISLLKRFTSRKRLLKTASHAHLHQMHWLDFEALVGEYYRQKGFRVTQSLSHAPDGGVDIELRKDEELQLVQCKHWKARKVGVKVLRELYGVMLDRRAKRMIVVTSGNFTTEAITFAASKHFELINGGKLLAMIEETKPKREAVREQLATRDEPNSHSPVCPKCKSPMVLRMAKQGKHQGSSFYGCSRFPQCRHIEGIPEVGSSPSNNKENAQA
ncbi:restriction endonuclease [Enterovibrio calviensis]|uniref:restriction endonuclease n=1 Tax=Enterovibrio calviensis TaxID=91359 RepID=UPI0006854B98|nr:restriction endonuclease [Enterovibrio calviensis]